MNNIEVLVLDTMKSLELRSKGKPAIPTIYNKFHTHCRILLFCLHEIMLSLPPLSLSPPFILYSFPSWM